MPEDAQTPLDLADGDSYDSMNLEERVMKRMTILIEEKLHRRLKDAARRRKTTMSDMVRDVIALQVMSRDDDPLFRNVPDDPATWKAGRRDSARKGDAFRG